MVFNPDKINVGLENAHSWLRDSLRLDIPKDLKASLRAQKKESQYQYAIGIAAVDKKYPADQDELKEPRNQILEAYLPEFVKFKMSELILNNYSVHFDSEGALNHVELRNDLYELLNKEVKRVNLNTLDRKLVVDNIVFEFTANNTSNKVKPKIDGRETNGNEFVAQPVTSDVKIIPVEDLIKKDKAVIEPKRQQKLKPASRDYGPGGLAKEGSPNARRPFLEEPITLAPDNYIQPQTVESIANKLEYEFSYIIPERKAELESLIKAKDLKKLSKEVYSFFYVAKEKYVPATESEQAAYHKAIDKLTEEGYGIKPNESFIYSARDGQINNSGDYSSRFYINTIAHADGAYELFRELSQATSMQFKMNTSPTNTRSERLVVYLDENKMKDLPKIKAIINKHDAKRPGFVRGSGPYGTARLPDAKIHYAHIGDEKDTGQSFGTTFSNIVASGMIAAGSLDKYFDEPAGYIKQYAKQYNRNSTNIAYPHQRDPYLDQHIQRFQLPEFS